LYIFLWTIAALAKIKKSKEKPLDSNFIWEEDKPQELE
jgi:hypothetical protein